MTTEAPILLVTGATGSIGGEIADQGAAAGFTVLVHGRTEISTDKAVAKLSEHRPGATFHPLPCDFLASGAIAAMIDQIDARFGRLDAVVNCAVSAPPGVLGRFAETDPGQYPALWHHALVTLQELCHAAFPIMARGGGSMVAVASDAGLFAGPNQSMIGPTRAAIMAFCRNLAMESSRDHIRVNCISTSYVEDTAVFHNMLAAGSRRPETARSRAGLGLPKPADIAALAMFLIGPGSAKLTGQVISVNGGLNA